MNRAHFILILAVLAGACRSEKDPVVARVGKLKITQSEFQRKLSEVSQGYECGLSIEGYGDLRQGDIIEAFEIETLAATLENPKGDSKRA